MAAVEAVMALVAGGTEVPVRAGCAGGLERLGMAHRRNRRLGGRRRRKCSAEGVERRRPRDARPESCFDGTGDGQERQRVQSAHCLGAATSTGLRGKAPQRKGCSLKTYATINQNGCSATRNGRRCRPTNKRNRWSSGSGSA